MENPYLKWSFLHYQNQVANFSMASKPQNLEGLMTDLRRNFPNSAAKVLKDQSPVDFPGAIVERLPKHLPVEQLMIFSGSVKNQSTNRVFALNKLDKHKHIFFVLFGCCFFLLGTAQRPKTHAESWVKYCLFWHFQTSYISLGNTEKRLFRFVCWNT